MNTCTLWPSNPTLGMSSTNTFKFLQNNICITDIIFLIISKVWAQTRCQQSSTDGKNHATSKQ